MKNARIERFGDQTILTRGWMRRAVPLPFLLRVTAAAVFAAACGSTGGGGSRQGRESRSPRRSAKFAPAGRGRTVDLGPAGCGFWALRERGGAGGGDCSLVPEDASSVSNHVRVSHVCVCCEHVHEVSLTQGIRQREKGEEETSEDEQAESGQAMLRPTRRPREVPGRIDQFCDPAAAETDHAGSVGPGQQLSRAQSGWDDQAGAKDKRDLWRGGTFSRPLGALGAVAVPDEQVSAGETLWAGEKGARAPPLFKVRAKQMCVQVSRQVTALTETHALVVVLEDLGKSNSGPSNLELDRLGVADRCGLAFCAL